MSRVEPFCDRLRWLMARSGFTQVQLSRNSGVERSLLSRYLSGNRPPTAGALELLGAALELNATTLAVGTDAMAILERAPLDPPVAASVAVLAVAEARKQADRADAAVARADVLERQLAEACLTIESVRQALDRHSR